MIKDESNINIINVTTEDDKFIDIEQGSNNKNAKSSDLKKNNHLNNLILSCVKNEEYCYTMLDYLKKMFHFSQIDYYSAYIQILYCFKPKEM